MNKQDAAAGRLILNLEADIAQSRKRVEMAEAQAATVRGEAGER
jgi:hypothetical protein